MASRHSWLCDLRHGLQDWPSFVSISRRVHHGQRSRILQESGLSGISSTINESDGDAAFIQLKRKQAGTVNNSNTLAQPTALNGDQPADTHVGFKHRMAFVRRPFTLLILGALLTIVRYLPLEQAMSAIKGWIAGLGFWGPIVLAVGLLATAVVSVYVTRLANRKLKEHVQEAPENGQSTDTELISPNVRSASRTRSTVMLVSAALLFIATATYTHFNAGTIERKLASLFAPPQVEMKEAYAGKFAGPTMDHSTFDTLLQIHVDENGWGDYEGLKGDEVDLDSYLSSVGVLHVAKCHRAPKTSHLAPKPVP